MVESKTRDTLLQLIGEEGAIFTVVKLAAVAIVPANAVDVESGCTNVNLFVKA